MALTKHHIVNSIFKELGLPKHKSMKAVESLLEILKQTIENGEDVLISGFGKFCIKEKKERKKLLLQLLEKCWWSSGT